MGYMHIENLYRNTRILQFRRCFALEKVHGTSAHVAWKDGEVRMFSGGEPLIRFAALFDKDKLRAAFEQLGHPEVTVYGEAYGGSQQGMGHTYGPNLGFIVFDVKVGETWLNVASMADVAAKLGFEVVPWEEISTDVEAVNAARDKPSEVAARRGMGADKVREGVVLRPLEETFTSAGHRVMVKHKIDKFGERKNQPKVHDLDGAKIQLMTEANAIAEEWVTEERLSHVVSHLTVDGVEPGIEKTRDVISAMIEDVCREAKDEIVESKEVKRTIGARAAHLFKKRLMVGALSKGIHTEPAEVA